MIYTVTLNPALDRFIVVEQLLTEDTTRILSETPYAAGKGIDVSRVLRELGGQSVALGLVGGYDGLKLEGLPRKWTNRLPYCRTSMGRK
jgi:6-phosphofructokinase 2